MKLVAVCAVACAGLVSAGLVVDTPQGLKSAISGVDSGKKVLVCPVVRFDAQPSCWTALFEDGSLAGDCGGVEDVYVRMVDSDNLIAVGGGDVGFVYLSGREVLMNPLSGLADISLLLESSNAAAKRSVRKVVILVDVQSTSGSALRRIEGSVERLLAEAIVGLDVTTDSIGTEVKLFDSSSSASVIKVRDELRTSLAQWTGGVSEQLLRPSDVLKHIKDSAPVRASVSAVEADASAVCASISDSFLTSLVPKLNALSAASVSGVSGIGVEEMHAIVESALSDAEDSIADTSARFGKTKAFRDTSTRVRAGLQSLLVDSYRNLLASSSNAAKADFNNAMRRQGPGSGLCKALKALAVKHVTEYTVNARETRASILEAFNTWQNESPLLGANLLKASNIGSMLAYDAEVKALANYCTTATKDRVDTLFLQGVYNPFVRTANYPPCHFNLNYLIDPRGIGFEIEHSRHYDTHEDRIIVNRAEALHVPSTARIPFNPMDIPQGKKEPSWWSQLRDFYLADD